MTWAFFILCLEVLWGMFKWALVGFAMLFLAIAIIKGIIDLLTKGDKK